MAGEEEGLVMEALRQFFDIASSTFTELPVDPAARTAVIIDPVDTHLDEHLAVIAREELTLAYVIETHAHADQVTSAGRLCQSSGAKTAAPVHCAILPADRDSRTAPRSASAASSSVRFTLPAIGRARRRTSGAIASSPAETLPMGGCGRTDFQDGDAGTLHDSITQKLFTLPRPH
jgi:glyoxylase-like metal-dependent hydrolase (beta-lactamase superfamily II)